MDFRRVIIWRLCAALHSVKLDSVLLHTCIIQREVWLCALHHTTWSLTLCCIIQNDVWLWAASYKMKSDSGLHHTVQHEVWLCALNHTTWSLTALHHTTCSCTLRCIKQREVWLWAASYNIQVRLWAASYNIKVRLFAASYNIKVRLCAASYNIKVRLCAASYNIKVRLCAASYNIKVRLWLCAATYDCNAELSFINVRKTAQSLTYTFVNKKLIL